MYQLHLIHHKSYTDWSGIESGPPWLESGLHTYILIYLLTPRSIVLLENLTGFQVVKKFLTFYGTRKFITAFTSAILLSLSRARSVQSMPPHPTA